MSFYMSCETPDGQSHSVQVGTNGSHRPMIALWLAAYAVCGRHEGRRVRVRWLAAVPLREGEGHHARAQYPIPWEDMFTVAGIQALIAYNHDDATWITFREETIDRGLLQTPPHDGWLRALMLLYQRVVKGIARNEAVTIPAEEVRAIAPVLMMLAPELVQSAWHRKMHEVAMLFQLASTHNVPIHC